MSDTIHIKRGHDISHCASVKIEYGNWLAYKLMLDGYQRNTKSQQENIKNLLTRSPK